MNVKEQYWKYSLVTIIVVLGTILFVEFIPFQEMTMQYIDYMPRKIAKENDAYFEEEENSLLACMQKGEKHG